MKDDLLRLRRRSIFAKPGDVVDRGAAGGQARWSSPSPWAGAAALPSTGDQRTRLDAMESVAPFLTVLDEHQPHAVLVLGVSTWDNIRFDDGTRSVVEANTSVDRTWIAPTTLGSQQR